jgi:hypothetical protein
MVSQSFIAYAFLLCLTTSANAHAIITPALGVSGAGTRNDVQRPSAQKPCGNINIAQTIGTSTAISVSSNGTFQATATDFNAGADGSRSMKSVEVDASGTGKNFVAAKILTNGNANPGAVGSDQILAQLPPGTKCTGGADGKSCLASYLTTAGFGNCAVLSQGGASQGANGQAAAASPSPSPKPAKKTSNNSAKNPTSDKNANNSNKNATDNSNKDTSPACNADAAKGGNQTTPGNNGRRAAGAGAANGIRRRASFKRNWDSRELVDLSD